MPRRSAGILLYRRRSGEIEVLAVHPGGPFWARRDEGAWSIPKGELDLEEDPLEAARREFAEELGCTLPDGPVHDLGEVRQKGGKLVRAFAVEGDLDPASIRSNTVEIEWPPRSGRHQPFPEIDRAEWLTLAAARQKLNPVQAELLDVLASLLGAPPG
jgi:predicted NUDIX family NTP pyrophosphohydrolase